MPVINDAVVVNSAYDTSGNGGRKLVRLSNRWLVSVVKKTTETQTFYFRVSKDNGNTWSDLCYYAGSSSSETIGDISIASKENDVYGIFSFKNSVGNAMLLSFRINVLNQTNTLLSANNVVDAPSTANVFGNVSLAINDAGTELHAAWASKNSGYAIGFNFRYAKGTISTDGSVVWEAAEQITKLNVSGRELLNPSILPNGNIIGTYSNGSFSSNIIYLSKYLTTFVDLAGNESSWGNKIIYSGGSYAQSSPTAIFVPQSINGLANGRIWVAWHGTDSTDTTATNFRISYSDDGGISWSAMQKVTTGNVTSVRYISLTANRKNEIFAVYESGSRLAKNKLSNGTWMETILLNISVDYRPSTLLDYTISVTEPLFIYRGSAKVGFYGSWVVTTNSVPSGDIGFKSNPSNLLSYALTTDGTMSTIIEKINGITIGTKNAASGQALAVSLTDAQWDALEYGKYANTSGGRNTLNIEMGTEKWTYTFTKTANESTTESQLVEAIKDMNEVFLPGVKEKLAVPIRSKGGMVPTNPSFEALLNSLGTLGMKQLSGKVTSNEYPMATVAGLPYTTKIIFLYRSSTDWALVVDASLIGTHLGQKISGTTSSFAAGSTGGNVFAVVVPTANVEYKWFVFG